MSGKAPASWDDSKPPSGKGLHRAIVNFLVASVSYNAMMRPWVMQEIERKRSRARLGIPDGAVIVP